MTVALSWSSGKDSAWALHLLRQHGQEVVALVTTMVQGEDRVTMHGTRRAVVRQQAALIGLPLLEIDIPWPCSDEMYRFAVGGALADLKQREGITAVAYGDLFLADIRRFREEMLAPLGLTASFPLWGMRTDLLATRMLASGVEARIGCLDPSRLDRRFAGVRWDEAFVRALPPEVDPCGENGEFHTVVTNGPMFLAPLEVWPAGTVERDGFVFADLTLNRPVDS